MDFVQRQDEFDRACGALREGEYARALALLDQLVAVDPDHAPYRSVRSHALLLQGNPEDALREAQRSIKLSPNSAAAHQVLAWSAWQAGQLSQAQGALAHLIELNDRSPESMAEYAEFMACARGPKLGEEAALAAITANEESATAWAALGIAQYRMHRTAEAEESLRRALRLDSNNPRAQWAMVQLLKDKGEYSQADALASFLRDNPGAEEFVAEVHDEALRRRTVAMLAEREDLPAPVASPGNRRERIALAAAIVATVAASAALAYFVPMFRPLAALAALWGAAWLAKQWVNR